MKKTVLYTLYFVVAYLIFVIATMPASFVVDKLTLPKDIKLSGISGTVWQSKVKQVANKDITINNIDMSLSVWSLLSLSPTVNATFGDSLKPGPLGKFTATYSNKELMIENADINVATNDLLKNAKLVIPLEAKGSLDIHLDTLQFDKPVCKQVIGSVIWPKAQVKSGKQNVLLGDLKADLGCDKGALTVIIHDKNDLGLAINASMRKLGKFSGKGSLLPGEKFPEALKPILGFLGKPDSEGKYSLRL